MIVSPPWLDIAYQDLRHGVMEVTGPKAHDRIVSAYAATTLGRQTDDEIAWCSAIMNLWMQEASVTAGIDFAPTRSARARSWLRWGVPVDGFPPFGAVTILTRAGASRDPKVIEAPGHVGLFLGLTQAVSDPKVEILAGNQSNRVCVRSFPLADVLGFRWAAPAPRLAA